MKPIYLIYAVTLLVLSGCLSSTNNVVPAVAAESGAKNPCPPSAAASSKPSGTARVTRFKSKTAKAKSAKATSAKRKIKAKSNDKPSCPSPY